MRFPHFKFGTKNHTRHWRICAGAWLFLSVAATNLQAQDKGLVYKVQYEFDSAFLTQPQEPVQQLFQKLHNEIVSVGPVHHLADSNFGQLVLPLSAEELGSGSKHISDFLFSPDNSTFLFQKYESSYKSYSYFLINNTSGQRIENFRNVRQIKYSKTGDCLIITFINTWAIYSLKSNSIVFQKEYSQMHYENGYEPDNILLLNDDLIIILEHQATIGELGYLFSLSTGQIVHTFKEGDADNMSNNASPHNNAQVSFDGTMLGFTAYSKVKNTYYGVIFDLQKRKEVLRLKQSLFRAWAGQSAECIIADEKGVFTYQLQSRQKKYFVNGIDYLNYYFGFNDSFIFCDPYQYAFSEGKVKIYNHLTGALIKEIVGTSASINQANPDYFIVHRFNDGPVLYRMKNFSEVLSMKEKESISITNSGKYLIIGDASGQSIVDLATSTRLLSRGNFNHFNEQTGDLIAIKSDCLLEFTTIDNKVDKRYYYANPDGWLCFDNYNHYDCSESFREQLYFVCNTFSTSKPEWPIAHKDTRYFTPGLWSESALHPATTGKEVCPPNAVTEKNTKYGFGNWQYEGSYLKYTKEKTQSIAVPKVSFIVDAETGKVDLDNFSAKPLKIIKASILYQCDVWDENGAALLFSYFVDYFGEYLAITPDGYYTKSKNFAGKVALKIQDTLYEISQLNENFYNPSILNALIMKQSVQSRYARNVQWGLAAPPKVEHLTTDTLTTRGETIALAAPKNQLTLNLRITNRGGGISSYRVFNNHKLLYDISLSDSAAQDTVYSAIRFMPSTGNNLIKIVAYSLDNTASEPLWVKYHKAATAGKVKKPNLYAIVVGINSYQNANYNLKYAVQDMQSFSDTISQISAALFDTVTMLSFTNSSATRTAILGAFEQLRQRATADDVFLFYYAGHGIATEQQGSADFHFVLHQVTQMNDAPNCAEYGLSGAEFKASLKNIQAQKQLCFIDACNSGAITQGFDVRSASKETALAKLNRYTGCAIFASTNQYQYASELDLLGHGVFTYALLEGLSGGAASSDCQITVSGIKLFLDNQVPRYTQQYRGTEQYPSATLFGQDFPFGLRCK